MPVDSNPASANVVLPSRQAIDDAVKKHRHGLRWHELVQQFKLSDDQQPAFRNRIDAMCRDQQLELLSDSHYQSTGLSAVFTGTIAIAARRTCVQLDHNSTSVDIFSARHRSGLIDGDRVRVMVVQPAQQETPKVVAVELCGRDREAIGTAGADGRIQLLHNIGLSHVSLPAEQAAGLTKDQPVLLRLHTADAAARDLSVELVTVLSPEPHADIDFETEVALRAFNVPTLWPRAVQQSVQAKPSKQPLTQNRTDLRDLPFVTIDGETAKDFDDAIACQKNDQGWQLWVAIADVATYVEPHSGLDREAQRRGNSVYFANGRCVPMLPAELSEDLCSLRPHSDRLVLAVAMQLSPTGELIDYHFTPGLIRSRARLSYTQVGELFTVGKDKHISQSLSDMLMEARQAYQQLHHRRNRRGALNIEIPEPSFLFAADNRVRGIVKMPRHDGHKMIEEFMICANVCAAGFAQRHHQDFLYRVHRGFKDGAQEILETFLQHRGLFLRGYQTDAVRELIDSLEERSDSHAIQSFVLRSLSSAVYQPDNQGHFGLALNHYAHYTSPIRRYPDLLMHRALYAALDLPAGHSSKHSELSRIGRHCSMTEKRADEVSRDINRYLQCIYAEDKIGQVHNGVIVGVTSFGLFVELDSLHFEGLVHISQVGDDYYVFSPQKQCLTPANYGQVYNLGDSVRVKITQVNPQERKIDFCMA